MVDTQPLPSLIERIVVNRRDLPLPLQQTGPLRLEAGSGQRLEFHFTAISLAAAELVKFRYRLRRLRE